MRISHYCGKFTSSHGVANNAARPACVQSIGGHVVWGLRASGHSAAALRPSAGNTMHGHVGGLNAFAPKCLGGQHTRRPSNNAGRVTLIASGHNTEASTTGPGGGGSSPLPTQQQKKPLLCVTRGKVKQLKWTGGARRTRGGIVLVKDLEGAGVNVADVTADVRNLLTWDDVAEYVDKKFNVHLASFVPSPNTAAVTAGSGANVAASAAAATSHHAAAPVATVAAMAQPMHAPGSSSSQPQDLIDVLRQLFNEFKVDMKAEMEAVAKAAARAEMQAAAKADEVHAAAKADEILVVVKAVVKAEIGKLRQDFDKLRQDFDKLQQDFGRTTEAGYRGALAGLEGNEQSKGILFNRLAQVASFVAYSLVLLNPEEATLNILNSLCRWLLEHNVAEKMLWEIANDIKHVDHATPNPRLRILLEAWDKYPFISESADGSKLDVNGDKLGHFIGMMKDKKPKDSKDQNSSISATLARIKKLMFIKRQSKSAEATPSSAEWITTADERMDMLRSNSDGIDMCLALFAAQRPDIWLRDGDNSDTPLALLSGVKEVVGKDGPAKTERPIKKHTGITVGQIELDVDIRGAITVINGHATLWAGEFKSSPSSSGKADQQLKLILDFYEWAVRAAEWPNKHKITAVSRTGKSYFPRHALKAEHVQSKRVDNTLLMQVRV